MDKPTQLTQREAQTYYFSGAWEKLSPLEIVKLQLYQERMCVPFKVFQQSINQVFGRKVHELAYVDVEVLQKEFEAKENKNG